MATLPLFPLGTVLLPGARLPLQLFEPRYLDLARALAELPDGERFYPDNWCRWRWEKLPDSFPNP